MENIKILVVDDEPDLVEVIAELLNGNGFEVRVAGNGLEAMKVLETYLPDYVLTDIKMPECNGIELFNRIQKLSPPLIPVMFMSGYTGEKEIEQIKSKDCIGFLSKPIDINDIITKIKAIHLNRHVNNA